MPLTFKNDTSLTLWVAFAHVDRSCAGSVWRKVGWYQVGPRGTRTVRTGSTKGNFYFYAEDTNRNHIWSGDTYTTLPQHAFSRCWDEPGGRNLGMKVFTSTTDDFTMSLYI
ncbi:DUF1036 domain-containing protein [Bacillus cereus]|uniref:DUF1036 domain-containing protein n=1 Tax=Bacillus cereus TaxID=1396 RepID=UPI003B66BE37